MKLTRLTFPVATLAALTTLSLFGCGGGGTPSSGGNGNFALLAGSGNATNLTVKYFRTVSLKNNTTYWISTGADQPCPVSIADRANPTNPSYALTCSDEDSAFRSDGKGTSFDRGVANDWSDAYTFSINGDTVTSVSGSGTSKLTTIATMKTEIIGGKIRIRLIVKKQVDETGAELPEYVGNEVVLEEVTPV